MRKAAGCVLLAILCLLGASYLPRILQEAQTDREQQNLISGYIQNPDTTDEENTESTTDEPEEETDPNMERIVDFQNLQQINPEILAWITVPGTPIDYPVALGEDNSYYLNHTVTGESNILGSIFATAGTDFEESHIILYGHNMASGKMFGSLKKYHDKDFRNTYPCNGVQREHNKKLNNGLPILHKVPPKRDYGRYFCIMAEKGGTSHGGLTEKLSPFFHAQKQEVNAYGR